MFKPRVAIRVRVSTNEYSIIWVNPNSTRLLNGSRFLNASTTCLLNGLVVSTHLSYFLKANKIYKF